MRKVLKFALRNRRVVSYLRRVYDEARTDSRMSPPVEVTIPEAEPLHCRVSTFEEKRLNLLVPALAIRHVFGGISTALSFFASVGAGMQNLRIILTDQQTFAIEDNPAFADWRICSLGDADGPGKLIVSAGDRYGKTLPVGPMDRFIATAWWTAVLACHIQQWQEREWRFREQQKYVYLIQDFEPGFYPWSSRFALAESTYHDVARAIAVFNSSVLQSFFANEGYIFPNAFTFEPTLNVQLRTQLSRLREVPKERRILIYGRPGVQRNAFEVIVMALKIWVSRNPDADWTFISAGEVHPPVDLGDGKKLTSLGKLSINEYANELARASVGISLMISPHPSYPPLEMAAFGMKVVTNKYKSKDLSCLTPNIVSIETVCPESVAQGIDQCLLRDSWASNYSPTAEWSHYLEASDTFSSLRRSVMPLLFNKEFVSSAASGR